MSNKEEIKYITETESFKEFNNFLKRLENKAKSIDTIKLNESLERQIIYNKAVYGVVKKIYGYINSKILEKGDQNEK